MTMFNRYTTLQAGAFAVVFALSAGALSVAHAQSSTSTSMSGMKLSSDEPIQIESNELQIREQEKVAEFTGNVKAVQGKTQLRAGRMIVHYKGEGSSVSGGNTDIDTIDVLDKVFLSTETQQATADTGRFDMTSQTFVLEGKQVVLSEGQNVFVGCRLTVQMDTGQAKLESCGKRVQIQLDPKSQRKP